METQTMEQKSMAIRRERLECIRSSTVPYSDTNAKWLSKKTNNENIQRNIPISNLHNPYFTWPFRQVYFRHIKRNDP